MGGEDNRIMDKDGPIAMQHNDMKIAARSVMKEPHQMHLKIVCEGAKISLTDCPGSVAEHDE